MNQEQRNLILQSASNFPPPKGVKLSYGTAGFRADVTLLRSTMYRVGILAALRSLKTQSLIGLMITASHNKVSDNGVKIADPNGGMLSQNWEPFADSLANAADPLQLLQLIEEFVRKENISFDNARSAEILLGRDTRPSGESLLEAAKQGINSIIGAIYHDMGILTTPQLHWMVRARNMGMNSTEQDYFEQLSHSYRCLVELIPEGNKGRKSNDKVVVDGANGVGGDKLEVLKDMCGGLSIEVRNSSKGEGVLNEGVGADFVQKEKVLPSGFGPNDVGLRCASFDGDADRLVYFLVQPDSKVIDLVDGDKMLSLFALYIKEQLDVLKDIDYEKSCEPYHPRLGIVQTAYANGASTDYLKNLGLDVVFTPTGVKYLHEKASEYDIGIYFEANGHGTILFSDSVLSWLEANSELSSSSTGSEYKKAVLRLLAASKLINQAVGDALSGLLLVEAILLHTGWSIQKWNELYKDLPSRQLKVKVVDRTAVVTANAETIVVQPAGIQDAINTATAKYHHGRCFIRPSGTEDVIRVYAEATTQEEADSLASDVAKLVDQYLGFGSSQ